jgi:adenine deaminase
LVTRLVTKERIVDLENQEESKDMIMVLALDRLGSGKAFMGLLKGFGLRRGAFATTMVWDMADMIVVGCDLHSMETAIERLKEIRGGCVYAIGEQVIAEFAAPLCGILSLKPMEVLREEVKKIEDALKENGVKLENPTLTIDVFGTPAIPHLRITHNGYVRLKDREILPVQV